MHIDYGAGIALPTAERALAITRKVPVDNQHLGPRDGRLTRRFPPRLD